MTLAATVQTYDEPIGTGTNREDLSDMLWDVSPTDTPGVTALGKTTATAISHDWPTDRLADAAQNAVDEGEDVTYVKPAARARLSNYTQILSKNAKVSGTQEKVLKGGGIKSEMAYQVARRMKEIKRDLEKIVFGLNTSKDIGTDADANERYMGSFISYMTSDTIDLGATGVAPTGNGVLGSYSAGTPRAIEGGGGDDTILKDALATLWENSGGNENIIALVGKHVRGKISTFNASSTRYVTTDDRKLVASIDVYDGDFHTVTVTPDRFSTASQMFLIDSEYAKIADLRPLFAEDRPKTGDAVKKQLLWETTLEVCDPLAHYVVDALATS